MTKKKKKKTRKLPADLLKQRIVEVLNQAKNTQFETHQLIKKLKISNPVEAVQTTLVELAENKLIHKHTSGKFSAIRTFSSNSNSKKKKDIMRATAIGIVDMTRNGSAYIVCKDDPDLEKDVYVPASRMGGAMNGDKVKIRWRASRRGKPEGAVLEILERKRDSFIGQLVVGRQMVFVIPDTFSMNVDIFVDRTKLGTAKHGDKVVAKITHWHGQNGRTTPLGEIKTVLGQAGSSDIEMKSILIHHGFDIAFPDEVLAENEAIDTTIPEEEIAKRLDFREVTTFTIDPQTAKDFDDALSVRYLENGNIEIGVHIADVGHYVREGSELDKEAALRTTSVYLVDRVMPMLPEKLSNGVCSLRPHEDKLTFSALFEFSEKGDLIGEWFGKTVTHSDRRFTYEEAQEIIESKKGDYAKELEILNRFAHQLRKARFKEGAMKFESPEVRFKLDEQGTPVSVYLKSRKDAHMLVEDFMLLANRRVATLIQNHFKATKNKIPFVYRIHDMPDMEKVAHFAGFAAELGYSFKANNPQQVARAFARVLKAAQGKPELAILQQLGIRTMAKAIYSTEDIGHYGLAFEHYTHFTSPIRRYADVLVHRILHSFLQKKNDHIPQNKLVELCDRISKKERSAMEAERESIKYKQVEFLENRVGDTFVGVISGMTERGVFIELRENYCEGMARFDQMYGNFKLSESGMYIFSPELQRAYRMGSEVWVKITGTNLQKRQIDMELLDEQPFIEDNVTLDSQIEYADFVNRLNKRKQKEKKPAAKTNKNETADKQTKETPAKKRSKVEEILDLLQQVHSTSALADQQHFYALAETAITIKKPLVLDFMPLAQKGETYEPMKTLPNAKLDSWAFYNWVEPLFKRCFPEGNLSDYGLSYFGFLRAAKPELLQAGDWKLNAPVFRKWIQYVQPPHILSFSVDLMAFLEKNGWLVDLEKKEVEAGKRSILVGRAKLKVGRRKIPIFFLPDPKPRIAKRYKLNAWKWVFENTEE